MSQRKPGSVGVVEETVERRMRLLHALPVDRWVTAHEIAQSTGIDEQKTREAMKILSGVRLVLTKVVKTGGHTHRYWRRNPNHLEV